MPKKIVVCCDGTWNRADQKTSAGRPVPTNVTKFALSVAPESSDGLEQRVYYQEGVGVRASERIVGGAFGLGLSRNIRAAYRFLVETYEPGDILYLVGFSRGAFTARSLAGFIRNAGILRPEHSNLIDKAYTLYRKRSSATHPNSVAARLFRSSYSREADIHFIGVWDTVGANGIPLSGWRLINVINRRWQFHDTQLSGTVKNAYHAIAIDEKRRPFEPTLWTRPERGRLEDDQRVRQVWFSGVHSDVGGGYEETGLSDISLQWIAASAEKDGLTFSDGSVLAPSGAIRLSAKEVIGVKPDAVMQPMHDSRVGFYKLVSAASRTLGRDFAETEFASAEAVRRRDESVYEAANLTTFLDAGGQRLA